MAEYKRVTVVNEQDEVIGYEEFFDAIEKGCIRQGACIFIVDEHGRHLIQKRSRHISKPLKLDKSVGGHVDEGSTYIETAHKEAEEELGLKGLTLQTIASSHRTTEFFESVYKAVIPSDTVINFDPQEVDSVYWMTTEEVDSLTKTNPGIFTKNFIELWNTFHDSITTP
jgi:isopentenyldiphosphate isomerase